MATNWTVFLITLALTLAQPAMAQKKKDIFANPQNLKVLPKDISSEQLGSTMKGISMGTGLRCEGCHVGEAGKPLTTFDFKSDEKAMKKKARLMIQMVDRINGKYIPTLDNVEKASRIEVRCVTCHRGQSKPKLIQDILAEKLASKGLNGALAEYETLREKYHGGFSYDFSEFVLPMFAQDLAASGNKEAGIAFAKTNVGYFPESTFSVYTLGELYESAGQDKLAIASYEKVIELAPSFAPRVQPKIDALRN